MDIVKKGQVVSITWVIRDRASGELLEQYDLPLPYLHGSPKQTLLPPLEQALEGKSAGDRFEVQVDPDHGFGRYDPELTFTDDIANVPPQFRRVGAVVEMRNARGETKAFKVSKIQNGRLTVDANHPLADKSLIFSVNVVDIRPATLEEIRCGEVIDGR